MSEIAIKNLVISLFMFGCACEVLYKHHDVTFDRPKFNVAEPVKTLKAEPPAAEEDLIDLPMPKIEEAVFISQLTSAKEQGYLDRIKELEAERDDLKAQIVMLTTPKIVPMAQKAAPVHYAPRQTYSSCGPNGCGPSPGSVRRGLLGRR